MPHDPLMNHMNQIRIYVHLLAKCGVKNIKLYRITV